MPVSVYRLHPTRYSSSLLTTFEPVGDPVTYKSLREVFPDLGIAPGDLIKVGKRGDYPFLYGKWIGLPENTAAFHVLGEYVAFVFEGRDEKWAKHCWLFDGGDRPFLPENVNDPPEPREKHDHEMTAKEWLFWKWGRTKRTPQETKIVV